MMRHPRDVLMGADNLPRIPVCDHYSGVESRMIKSLAMQADLAQEYKSCVFDVTLDCEDGAPVGGEQEHAHMVAAMIMGQHERFERMGLGIRPRVAVRVHPVDHLAFEHDLGIILGAAAQGLCHVMVPKVESRADVERAASTIDAIQHAALRSEPLPLHVLIESPAAVHHAFEIAAHPLVQSLSFGLMDFVSAHGGYISDRAMLFSAVADEQHPGQFDHPLVVRAKLNISQACHAHSKVASHCVVTEFKDLERVKAAATLAFRHFGFARMWSIHPSQIRPILEAFAPADEEIDQALDILLAAVKVDWAPISHQGKLQDRASYRYFWQLLERAHRTGRPMPQEAQMFFSSLRVCRTH